jgi:hypothetical protein
LVLRLPPRDFEAFPKIWRSHVFRDAHKRNYEFVDETLIFQGHSNFFGARSWLRCVPVDGLTKNVVKQNVYPLEQAFKQDQCELFAPISRKIQVFEVRVKVSFF